MDADKERFAQPTSARKLAEVIVDADIFLGLSAGGVLKKEMVAKMAPQPLILALANPTPEIMPEEVDAVRDDAIIATGRSDYPNQVNNVLCFPFIFRGALDVGATTITTEMEVARRCLDRALAQEEQSDIVASATTTNLAFGREYLIPKPFDPRLITRIAPAVAQAAMASGVATRPIGDLNAYRDQLQQFVYHSGLFMKPIFTIAKNAVASGGRTRIVFAEGEEERVLRAVQVVIDEKLATPIVIGRPQVVEKRLERFGLRMRIGTDFELVNPEFDRRYRDYWETYHRLAARRGVTQQYAKIEMRRRLTLIGAMMIHKGDADGLICGTFGTHRLHLPYIDQVIGRRSGVGVYAAMNILMLAGRQLALVDTHVNEDPTAAEVAEIAMLAAEQMKHLGLTPRIALVSHSNFGTSDALSARKTRRGRPDSLAVTGSRSGRRDACRHCGRRRDPPRADAVLDAARRRQPDRLPEHRLGEYLLQPAEGDGRQ
jgi:malate dehydrogenase (oxaloacetate-decarboxylating)(NADP+)